MGVHRKKVLPLSAARLSRKKGWRRRRKLLKLAKLMEATDETRDESTDPSNSVGSVTNSDINIKMTHPCRIKKKRMDNNDARIKTCDEEEIVLNEHCERTKSFVFVNVDNIEETERYEEEDARNETIEHFENDSIFLNIDNADATKSYEEGTCNQSIEYSVDTKNIIIDNDCSVNALNTQENTSTGRCIVNFTFMWNETHKIFNNHAYVNKCQFQHWKLVNYRRRGLLTQFFFKCQTCHYEASIWSEPVGTRTPDINAVAVSASNAVGMEFSQLRQLFTAMDLVYMP